MGKLVLTLLLVLTAQISLANDTLFQQGFREWQWLTSDCFDCDIYFHSPHPLLNTEKTLRFTQTLSERKQELLTLYGVSGFDIHGQEYTHLAHIAIGILGRESLFFESRRYHIKETFPWLIRMAKIIQIFVNGGKWPPSPNSRGPTQIKVIPPLIKEHYGFTEEELYIPENAAIATMGFLIEGLTELKRRVRTNRLDFINPTNYVDYLPYIYFGGTRQLINKTATPDKNIYVKDMKKYMSWVQVFERPRFFELGRAN